MVTIGALWLAILLSAVIVWIASAIVWMFLPHHKTEFQKLPNEEALRSALRSQNAQPGQYNIPYAGSSAGMKEPEFMRKMEEGPVGILTLMPTGKFNMGKSMTLSFAYYLVVGIFVAYLASRTLQPGEEYLSVFRLAGTTAWLAYGWGIIPESIWFGRPWKSMVFHLADTLAYALLTAGIFGWLWPR